MLDTRKPNGPNKSVIILCLSLLAALTLTACLSTPIPETTGCEQMTRPILTSATETNSGQLILSAHDAGELLLYVEALEKCAGVR